MKAPQETRGLRVGVRLRSRLGRYLLRLVGPERIALGSDFPFPLGEAIPGRLIETMEDLTGPTRDRLLAGTALQFLGRRREEFLS